jgi:hypothetical protein
MVDRAYQRPQFQSCPGKEAYREATRYLHMIAHVTIKEPRTNGHDDAGNGCSSDTNAKLLQLNQQGGLDAHTCIIDLMSVGSLWHIINSASSPEAKQTSKWALRSLCDGYYHHQAAHRHPMPTEKCGNDCT